MKYYYLDYGEVGSSANMEPLIDGEYCPDSDNDLYVRKADHETEIATLREEIKQVQGLLQPYEHALPIAREQRDEAEARADAAEAVLVEVQKPASRIIGGWRRIAGRSDANVMVPLAWIDQLEQANNSLHDQMMDAIRVDEPDKIESEG